MASQEEESNNSRPIVPRICTRRELAKLLEAEREELLSRWRTKVRKLPSAKDLDIPTLNNDVPAMLDELVIALFSGDQTAYSKDEVEDTSIEHGLQRFDSDYNIEEIVWEYNMLRESINSLANERSIVMGKECFQIVNHFLTQAVAHAVRTFALQQAAKIQEQREEHLAFVAHDLRTPVNALKLSITLLKKRIPEHIESRENVSDIIGSLSRNIENLERLVKAVLGEKETVGEEIEKDLKKEQFFLYPFVAELLQSLEPIGEAISTKLINEVPVEMKVYADPERLRRILQNLVDNGLTHTANGEVVIGAEQLSGGGVECWIRDTGIGISEEDLERIFEKYESDSDSHEHYGLGLSIAKKFVEAHGGKITVESEREKGSIFKVSLPEE